MLYRVVLSFFPPSHVSLSRQVPWLADSFDPTLTHLLERSYEVHLKRGQVLLGAGDAHDVVFVVMRGLLLSQSVHAEAAADADHEGGGADKACMATGDVMNGQLRQPDLPPSPPLPPARVSSATFASPPTCQTSNRGGVGGAMGGFGSMLSALADGFGGAAGGNRAAGRAVQPSRGRLPASGGVHAPLQDASGGVGIGGILQQHHGKRYSRRQGERGSDGFGGATRRGGELTAILHIGSAVNETTWGVRTSPCYPAVCICPDSPHHPDASDLPYPLPPPVVVRGRSIRRERLPRLRCERRSNLPSFSASPAMSFATSPLLTPK